ncbi:MAG: hypothetical protein KAQ85_09130 [Thermodesulfovibrionia bacterium]|nr:hypothetical protein [Thermodesulfovibrionia bacterium]
MPKPEAGRIDREVAGEGDIPIRRIGKDKSEYYRSDGTKVKGHVQRYWHGSKVTKKVPHYNVFAEGIEENERIRQARRQYYATSTIGQRLWDNEEYATIDIKGKLQPGIFGRDDEGNAIPIEDWQYALWQSRPNQYDIYRVDDPIPDSWKSKVKGKFDGRKPNQSLTFYMHDKKAGEEMGNVSLSVDRTKEEYWDAKDKKWKFRWVHTGSPSLTVEPEYQGIGVSTYLKRDVFDFCDMHDIRFKSSSASPEPNMERGVRKRGKKLEYFEETDEEFKIRKSKVRTDMRDMYMSFGITDGPTKAEILSNPSATFSMSKKPYSKLAQEILRKRQVKKPDTAEYEEKKTKAAKKRQKRPLMAVRE